MVTEMIVRHRCDLCGLVEEGAGGTIKTLPIGLFGKSLECDLCEGCRTTKVQDVKVSVLVQMCRTATNPAAATKGRQRKGEIVLCRSEEDGLYYCPLCPADEVYKVQANSAIRYHLQSKHPAEAPNYRISDRDGRLTLLAAKKGSAPRRSAKKATARSRSR